MATITTAAMNTTADGRDNWLTESLGRGGGAFVGRITPAGDRTFLYRYTDENGRRCSLKIGDYDPQGRTGLTVAKARQVAVKWSALYRGDATHGIAPVHDLKGYFERQRRDEQARARAEEEARQQAELAESRRLTVRQVFERWAAVDLQSGVGADGKRTGRKDGGEYTRRQFERYLFPTLGHVAVADVRKADLMTVLDVPKAAGKLRTANVLLTDLKQMLRYAVHREIVDRNVLDTVEKRAVGGRETERDRWLTDAEIRQLVQKLPGARMGARSEIAIALILATACRVGELMNARWEHVNLDAATWHIPPEQSKNERDHTIHLSAFAIERFKTLHTMRERGTDGELLPWVFPNRSGTGAVCIKSFGKQLADRQRADEGQRLSRRTLNTDSLSLSGGHWTAHDLRRTAATIMGRLGFSADVIDECLNHIIQSRVTRVYVRDRREADQARAFEALGQHLEGLFTGADGASNVVPMQRAAA